MSNLRTVVIAAVAAVVTEGVAGACFGHVGPDGPDFLGWIGVVVFYPAIALAQELRIASTVAIVLICFVELFVFYWFVVMIWNCLRYGRRVSQPKD